jgi:hypothetical protein
MLYSILICDNHELCNATVQFLINNLSIEKCFYRKVKCTILDLKMSTKIKQETPDRSHPLELQLHYNTQLKMI